MAEIPPVPPAVPPPAVPAGSGSAGTAHGPSIRPVGEVAIERLPPRLAGPGRPLVVTGMPAGTTEDGALRLRTPMGEVLLRTRVALPPDRPVTLHIPAGAPPGGKPTLARAFVTMPAQPLPASLPSAGPRPPVVAPPAASPAASGTTPASTGRPGLPSLPVGSPPAVGTIIPATVVATIPATAVATAPLRVAAPTTPAKPAPHQLATAAAAYGAAGPAPHRMAPALRAEEPALRADDMRHDLPARPAVGTPRGPGVPGPRQMPGPPMPAPHAPASDGPAGGVPTSGPRPKADSGGGDASNLRAATSRAAPPPASAPLPAAASRPSPLPDAPLPMTAAAKPAIPAAASPPPVAAASTQPPSPGLGAGSISGLRQGMPVELHVLRAPPLPGEAAVAPPPAATGRITASVAGSTPAGQTVLSTASGTVVIQARAVLPAGTQVALGLPATTAAPSFSPFQQTDWPNLRMAMDALRAADPGGAQTLLARVLPQAGPHLAAAIAHFTAVTRQGGDTRRWLGDRAAQVLEAVDGGRALSALDEDLRTLARQPAEPVQGDWRAYSLPFADGQAVTRIQLFVRNAGEDEKEAGGRTHASGTRRFVIDAELSRTGPLQLDGLTRDRRFDLVLRTHEPLPADMRQDIQRLFAVTIEALGLSGAVSFQGSGQGWLTLAPVPAATGRGVVA